MLKTIETFLEGKTLRDVCIQNRDHEDTFVNLSCDEDLIDACRCLRPVDNSEDLYKLSVRVHTNATPVQAVHVYRTERTIVNEPAKRRVFHQRRENSLVTGTLVVPGLDFCTLC